MKLIERIKALPRERRSTTVEAWGEDDSPVTLYALPLSVADMSWIQKIHKNFMTDVRVEGMVDLIIRKCEDEDGDKAFSKEDKPTLMHAVTLDTMAGIFGDLWGDRGDFGEDAEKN